MLKAGHRIYQFYGLVKIGLFRGSSVLRPLQKNGVLHKSRFH